MGDKKYDWFAALVQNPDLMISDFKNLGVTPDNSEFKSRSDYEGLPQVQEAFKDANGKFNKEAFNQYYDNALLLYNNYAQNEYIPKATELFGYLDTEWDRPNGSKVIDTTPRFSIADTAQIQSYGIDYINKSGNSLFGKQSVREIAQQQKVVDFETGKMLDWTPDDKTGLIDALFRPTLVLASYDEDEYDKYLKSPQWQAKRSERLKIDNYTCQRCGLKTNLKCYSWLEIHHLNYRNFKEASL